MCSEEDKRSAKDCNFEKKYEIVELSWGADQKFSWDQKLLIGKTG